jgi:hypothetical protein
MSQYPQTTHQAGPVPLQPAAAPKRAGVAFVLCLLALCLLALATAAPAGAATMRAPVRQGTAAPRTSCLNLVGGTFSATATTVPVGQPITLSLGVPCLQPGQSVRFIDESNGASVPSACRAQGGGDVCSLAVIQPSASTLGWTAVITGTDFSFQEIFLSWESPYEFVVNLSGPASVPTGGTGTYTATANVNVGPTPYFIEIFDETTGAFLGECPSGTSCSVSFQPPQGVGADLVAFVSYYSTSLPPAGAQASSNILGTAQEEPIQ